MFKIKEEPGKVDDEKKEAATKENPVNVDEEDDDEDWGQIPPPTPLQARIGDDDGSTAAPLGERTDTPAAAQSTENDIVSTAAGHRRGSRSGRARQPHRAARSSRSSPGTTSKTRKHVTEEGDPPYEQPPLLSPQGKICSDSYAQQQDRTSDVHACERIPTPLGISADRHCAAWTELPRYVAQADWRPGAACRALAAVRQRVEELATRDALTTGNRNAGELRAELGTLAAQLLDVERSFHSCLGLYLRAATHSTHSPELSGHGRLLAPSFCSPSSHAWRGERRQQQQQQQTQQHQHPGSSSSSSSSVTTGNVVSSLCVPDVEATQPLMTVKDAFLSVNITEET